jgi:hypothetical protein
LLNAQNVLPEIRENLGVKFVCTLPFSQGVYGIH